MRDRQQSFGIPSLLRHVLCLALMIAWMSSCQAFVAVSAELYFRLKTIRRETMSSKITSSSYDRQDFAKRFSAIISDDTDIQNRSVAFYGPDNFGK
jgi:hypothetical protein